MKKFMINDDTPEAYRQCDRAYYIPFWVRTYLSLKLQKFRSILKINWWFSDFAQILFVLRSAYNASAQRNYYLHIRNLKMSHLVHTKNVVVIVFHSIEQNKQPYERATAIAFVQTISLVPNCFAMNLLVQLKFDKDWPMMQWHEARQCKKKIFP